MFFVIKALIERIKKLSLNEIAFSGAKYADLIDNAIDHEDPDVPRVDPLKIPGISKVCCFESTLFPHFFLLIFYYFTYRHHFSIEFSGWEREDYAELQK